MLSMKVVFLKLVSQNTEASAGERKSVNDPQHQVIRHPLHKSIRGNLRMTVKLILKKKGWSGWSTKEFMNFHPSYRGTCPLWAITVLTIIAALTHRVQGLLASAVTGHDVSQGWFTWSKSKWLLPGAHVTTSHGRQRQISWIYLRCCPLGQPINCTSLTRVWLPQLMRKAVKCVTPTWSTTGRVLGTLSGRKWMQSIIRSVVANDGKRHPRHSQALSITTQIPMHCEVMRD